MREPVNMFFARIAEQGHLIMLLNRLQSKHGTGGRSDGPETLPVLWKQSYLKKSGNWQKQKRI